MPKDITDKQLSAAPLKMLKEHEDCGSFKCISGRLKMEWGKRIKNRYKLVLTLSLSTTVPTGVFSGTLTAYVSCVKTGLLSSTSVTRMLRVKVVRRGSTALSEASTTTSYWLRSSRSSGTLV